MRGDLSGGVVNWAVLAASVLAGLAGGSLVCACGGVVRWQMRRRCWGWVLLAGVVVAAITAVMGVVAVVAVVLIRPPQTLGSAIPELMAALAAFLVVPLLVALVVALEAPERAGRRGYS